MNTLLGIVIVGMIIFAILILFKFYVKFLLKITINRTKKRIASGKITDQKLTKLYTSFAKSKDNKLAAIFTLGIFYKSLLTIYQANYEIYREEMIKRNLPL